MEVADGDHEGVRQALHTNCHSQVAQRVDLASRFEHAGYPLAE